MKVKITEGLDELDEHFDDILNYFIELRLEKIKNESKKKQVFSFPNLAYNLSTSLREAISLNRSLILYPQDLPIKQYQAFKISLNYSNQIYSLIND